MTALQQQPEDDAGVRSRRRVRTLQDLLVFQVKLLLEGFKDIVLGPLSLGAAVFDFVLAKQAPNRYLDAVMRLGRSYERGVDLYSALEAHEAESEVGQAPSQLAAAASDQVSQSPTTSPVGADTGRG